MRLLLTSAGMKNTSIHDALVDLLSKPIAEASALCVLTAAYGHPMAGPGAVRRLFDDESDPVEVAVTDSHTYDNGVISLTYSAPMFGKLTRARAIRST